MSLASLRKLYPGPQFIHLEQVRSSTGGKPNTGELEDDLTIADLIIVNTWKSRGSAVGLDLRYVEYKDSAADFGAERRAGVHKSKLAIHCTETWLAVSSRKKVIPDLSKLPEGWGCVDVGGAKPVICRDPVKREPSMPPPDFLRALLRAATADDAVALAIGAPLRTIDRPDLLALAGASVGVLYHAIATDLGLDIHLVKAACEALARRGFLLQSGKHGASFELHRVAEHPFLVEIQHGAACPETFLLDEIEDAEMMERGAREVGAIVRTCLVLKVEPA